MSFLIQTMENKTKPRPELMTVAFSSFTLSHTSSTQLVQVEKRFSADESFGQNRTKSRQIHMTMRQLVDKLKCPEGELLYLSTQQPPPDDKEKVPAASQTPCAQLLHAKKIESTLSWGSTLNLESCNLWMGSSKAGSSSGLHHDYHDNFYLLVQGVKQFRLYSPDTAYSMSTYGAIEKIHFNGVISYIGAEIRADGTPVERATTDGDNNHCDDEDDGASDNDEGEEEIVLGKGFDYQSDEEEEEIVDLDGPDDFDELVDKASHHNDSSDDEDEDETATGEDENAVQRPNSFSRIDPTNNVNVNLYPEFQACKEYIVELKAGQILYLPAGWFHQVTSFNSFEPSNGTTTTQQNKSQVHLAFNYWYHPPDRLDWFSSPYTDRGK